MTFINAPKREMQSDSITHKYNVSNGSLSNVVKEFTAFISAKYVCHMKHFKTTSMLAATFTEEEK